MEIIVKVQDQLSSQLNITTNTGVNDIAKKRLVAF